MKLIRPDELPVRDMVNKLSSEKIAIKTSTTQGGKVWLAVTCTMCNKQKK